MLIIILSQLDYRVDHLEGAYIVVLLQKKTGNQELEHVNLGQEQDDRHCSGQQWRSLSMSTPSCSMDFSTKRDTER